MMFIHRTIISSGHRHRERLPEATFPDYEGKTLIHTIASRSKCAAHRTESFTPDGDRGRQRMRHDTVIKGDGWVCIDYV